MNYQEIINKIQNNELNGQNLFAYRLELIKKIEQATSRPLIVYAAKLNAPREAVNQINLDDLIGFADLISKIEGPNLDILIESPGGVVDAAQRIVQLLRQKYKSIRFLIPGSAYSAATMIALSGNQILMGDASSLGPIDPQISGIPARSILNGFDTVRKTLKDEGPSSLPAYLPLIQKYDLHTLEICKDAEDRGKQLVQDWLIRYMFDGDTDATAKASAAVTFFSDYNQHKSHARPIFLDDAKSLGIKVESIKTISPVLDEHIWDLYLHIRVLFDHSPNIKIFENSRGVNWGNIFLPPGISLQPGSILQKPKPVTR